MLYWKFESCNQCYELLGNFSGRVKEFISRCIVLELSAQCHPHWNRTGRKKALVRTTWFLEWVLSTWFAFLHYFLIEHTHYIKHPQSFSNFSVLPTWCLPVSVTDMGYFSKCFLQQQQKCVKWLAGMFCCECLKRIYIKIGWLSTSALENWPSDAVAQVIAETVFYVFRILNLFEEQWTWT